MTVRRKRAYVSLTGTTSPHLRNPFVIASWSAAFPGLGHLLLSKYLRGFLLFSWEVFINYNAHINLAIYDSYRSTVDANNNFILAAREDAVIVPFKVGALEINF